MTTQNEILTLVCKVIAASPIDALNGGIYKNTRPTGSELEDCVASLINGSSGKFLLDGSLSVKIFYKDINSDDSYLEDTKNGQVLETLLFDLSETLLSTKGISFEIQTRETYTESIPEIHQHYAILKMDFKITQNE